MERLVRIGLIAILLGVVAAPLSADIDDYERSPFHYSDTESTCEIETLSAELDDGRFDVPHGVTKDALEKVLRRLEVPVESQVLVYSKTSLQNDRIGPKRPRALYFSDDCYVGWVQGGDIEIAATDRTLGLVFYRMRLPKSSGDRAEVYRDRTCLNCHGSSRTDGYPGVLVRSVYPDGNGFPILGAGTFQTDHRSPLAERWGGWYVTGQSDGEAHMGNRLFRVGETSGRADLFRDFGRHLDALSGLIDENKYPGRGSDIVALMVLEHQVTVHNAITKAHYNTRRWLHTDQEMARELGDHSGIIGETTRRSIERQADSLLETMLFRGEFELEGWGVEGGEAFQEMFAAAGRRATSGRSLRDFDLISRLFKHRLSYMIDSDAFASLPPEFAEVFYQKLGQILDGGVDGYAYFGSSERERILEILAETHAALPVWWDHE